MLRRKFKPSQKIERFAKLTTMMQSSGDRRQIFQAEADMAGPFLEYSPAFVLSQAPPGCRFAGRDKRRASRFRSREALLARLNVVLEADSLSLQTRSSKLVTPVVTRHIALAMSRHASLTLACQTVMQLAREIAKSGAAGLRRKT
jgi:hypothetical protein